MNKQWRFYPLYGLTITDDTDGLGDPIFKDGTLVTPEFIIKMAHEKTAGSGAAQFLTGQPMGPNFPADSSAFHAAPKAFLFEQQPHCWIAVRRLKETDGREYAQRMAAFLTACMVLKGKHVMSFSLRPDVLAWSIVPDQVQTNANGQLESRQKILVNNHVVLNPISVRKSDLRASWHSGSPMTFKMNATAPSGTWDINKNMPIAAVCLGLGPTARDPNATKSIENLSSAALHLFNACCAKEVAVQIQMAVSALEIIFETNNFTELRKIAFTFITAANERARIDELLKARHQFVHRGMLDNEKATQIAKDGIHLAYVYLDVFSGFAAANTNYREKIAIYIEAHLLADRLEATNMNKAPQATEIRKAVALDGAPKLSSQMP